MTTPYEDTVRAALQTLEAASANGVFPAALSSSLRRQLEDELRAVHDGRLQPRSLATALSHQMFDSGHIDDDFSSALDAMLAAEGSASGAPTLLPRVTVRQMKEADVRTLKTAGPLLGNYGLLVPAITSDDVTRLITVDVEGRRMLPAFSSRELFDEWASGATEAAARATLVPAGGVGGLASGVDIVINPLTERLMLTNERTIPAGAVSFGRPTQIDPRVLTAVRTASDMAGIARVSLAQVVSEGRSLLTAVPTGDAASVSAFAAALGETLPSGVGLDILPGDTRLGAAIAAEIPPVSEL
ncbi:SseB family protein [uncultured Microbacterium sp.]|uniref:SseB family protein n=1 Tax=uncultured Microbacterium sp. TaxID=191216 RepID=UPI0026308893|nr:SseB family protein [uncultured Microbacterium sp.]